MTSGIELRSSSFASRSLALWSFLVALLAVPASAQPFGYITSQSSQDVSVLNLATNTRVATIKVPVPTGFGGVSPTGVALHPDGSKLYVVGSGTDRVHVFDTTTNALITTLTISNPFGIAINPAGTLLYLPQQSLNTVAIVDTSTYAMSSISVTGNPTGVVVNPAGDRVYVTRKDVDAVAIIDVSSTPTVLTSVLVGDSPRGMAINSTGTRLYVANDFGDSVSVIDTTTNTLVTTVIDTINSPSKLDGPFALAITPNDAFVYVPSQNKNAVTVIETTNNTITNTIQFSGTSHFPVGINIHPAGTTAYVVSPGSSTDKVFLIDIPANTINATSITVGDSPIAFGLFIGGPASLPPALITSGPPPKGVAGISYTFTYTSNWNATFTHTSGTLPPGLTLTSAGLLSGTPTTPGTYTGVVTASNGVAPADTQAYSITIYPTPHAYIANSGGTDVSVVNTATNSLVTTITVGTAPIGVAADAAGTVAYVANSGSNDVSVIDVPSNTVTTTVSVGTTPFGVALNPAGTFAYVTNSGSTTVSVIDTSTNLVIDTVTVGTAPQGVAVSPNGSQVYVANSGSDTVSVIDTSSNIVTATIAVGDAPLGLALTPTGAYLYVANFTANTISVIDTSTNTVLTTIILGCCYGPMGVAADPSGNTMYVTAGSQNRLLYIDVATNTKTAEFNAGSSPRGIAVNEGGTHLYVVSESNSQLNTVNIAAKSWTTSASVGLAPQSYGLFLTVPATPTPPTITSATPPNGTVNVAYNFTYTATGSPSPTFTSTPTLPPGLTLTSGGVLSGTPTAAGSYTGTVTATNGVSPDASQAFNITIAPPPPVITNGPPPNGTVGSLYTFTYTATNSPAFSFTGALPPGLSLSPSGTISGTPTATGSYSGTVTATNGTTPDATQNITITIAPPPPVITNGPPPNGTVGSLYTFTYTATNSPAFNFTGTLPPGLSLSPSGTISGTPTATGSYSGTVTATNGTAPDATQNFTITITAAAPVITNGPPPNGTVGSLYSFTYTATNSPTFSFTGTLPPGLSLSPSGTISGTPTAAGTFSGTVTATNGTPPDATQNFTITIAAAAPVITNGPPPNGTVGSLYTFTYTATSSPTFSFTGTLPPGLSLSPSGTISGTPTATGSYSGTVTATNGTPPDATQNITITITAAAPVITNGPPPNGTVGSLYSFTYTATNSPTFSFTGTLPPGLSLSPSGTISGTPTAAGTFSGTVTATNGTAPDATQNFTITIGQAAPTITNGPPPNGTVGSLYTFTYTATSSPTFSFTGTLPPGLSLSPSGTISGTPTTAGTFSGTVTATNGTAPDATQNFTITIAQPAPTITNGPPPNGTVGSLYTFTYTATSSPTFSFTGTLPPGLTFTSTGVFSGTPTTAGTFSGTVSASNGTPPDATQNITILISAGATADVSIAKSGPAQAPYGSVVTYTIAVTNNGPASATSVVVSDPTPAGLRFISNSGACSTPFPCSLGTLSNGQVATITATYEVVSGGSTASNTATVSSASDSNATNDSSTQTTSLTCPTRRPEQVSPPAAATNVPTSGTLRWRATGGASYVVYLGPAGSGCSIELGSSLSTSIAYSGLAPATTYEWRVKSLTPGCPTQISSCETFRTAAVCNATAPLLLTPAAGSNASSPIDFSWTAVDGATDYAVFAAIGDASAVEIGRTTSTSIVATLGDGPIRWYVIVSVPDCGNLQSATGNFNNCNAAAAAPRVVGQVTSGQTYRLEWDPVPNASRYEVDEATDAAFSDARTFASDATTRPFTHQTDVPVAFYYRVRTFSTCDPNHGTVSATLRVVIIPLSPVRERNPSVNVPAGSKELVVHDIFIPGEPGVTSFFSASVDRSWLSVTPASGPLPPSGVTLELTADPAVLPNGTFTGTVVVVITDSSASAISTNGSTVKSTPFSINLVTPISPVTSVQSPAANSLVIPSVGHLNGVNSLWQSDIRVTNTTSQAMKYTLIFTPANPADGIKQTEVEIEGAATMALDDIVANWFGIGSIGDAANGSLQIRPMTAAAGLNTIASSRTYNLTGNGTLGQFIPAIPFPRFIGKTSQGPGQVLSLQQIAQNSSYRTNVGLLEASGQAASATLSVLSGTGQKLLDLPLQLAGGQQLQLNGVLAQNKITLDDGRVEVRVTGGSGKVTAYASTIDNRTGDPLLVSPVEIGLNTSSKYVLLGVADLKHSLANWQTDMRVFNSGGSPQTATMTFVPFNGGAPSSAAVTIAQGEVRSFDNTVQTLFGASNVGGAVHITTPVDSSLVVTGRTYNSTSAGTLGQFIPAVTPAEAVARGERALNVLQVEDSVRYRTNLGVAEVTGKPVTLEVQVILPDSKATPTVRIPLAANEYRQFSIIRELGLGNVYNARVSVRVVDGEGRVTAYGSIIDELTQDPTYVVAQ